MSKIVFSFDDGRFDTFRAVNIAASYGIFCTLNITPGFILKDPSIDETFNKMPLDLDELSMLQANRLVEIASHSYSHNNNYGDIKKGNKVLKNILKVNEPLGFASPHSELVLDDNLLIQFHKDGFKYIRLGPYKTKWEFIKRIVRKISRVLGLQRLLYFTYKSTLKHTSDGYLLYGVPVLNDYSVNQLKYLVKKSIKHNYSIILIFHSVDNINCSNKTDRWTLSLDKYTSLCEYISELQKQNLIHSAKTADLVY